MAYSVIENFSGGVDRSRPIYALPPGTLYEGINGHISRGGDFEQRKSFVATYDLPADTFGFASAGDELYVFGSASAPTMPSGVTYQRLQHPDGVAMSAVLSYDLFNGKIYAAAEYTDGTVHHFYDGAIVTDWTDGIVRAAMLSNGGIASHLRDMVNGKSWAAGGGTYNATVAGSTVTVTKGATFTSVGGSASNGIINTVNDQSLSVGWSAGQTIATFAVSGTFEANDRFTITLEGVKYGAAGMPEAKGTVIRTHKRKVYAAAGSILNFSGLDAPTFWNRDDDSGAGFLNFADQQGGAESIVSLAEYQNSLSLFARRVTQLWQMFSDDASNTPQQVLPNTGSVAQKSARQYGDVDTFYLSDTGVRSLRARDVTNTAAVSDVGTPIDKYILDYAKTLTDEQLAAACATVEPVDGRFMLSLGTKVFVFSYFPAKKISAWTWYELDFEVSDWAITINRLYARSGDVIYLYGGPDNDTYDEAMVTCWLPFFSAKRHGTYKQLQGLDIASEGTWNAIVLPNPNDLEEFIDIGTMSGFTFPLADTSGQTHCTHMSVKLTKSSAEYGSVSMVGIYYTGAEAEA